MEADVLNALSSKENAYITGGRDRDGRLLIVIPVPYEIDSSNKVKLELCIKYLLQSLSDQSKSEGLIIVIDAQKCSWRLARTHMRYVISLIQKNLANIIVIRPDVFWDKQRVENCAKSHKKGEVRFCLFLTLH